MAKVEMISQATHRYGGVSLRPGDKFIVNNETDADELRIIGFATRTHAEMGKGAYETKPMVAGPNPAPPSPADAPRARRAYKRRDLKAQG